MSQGSRRPDYGLDAPGLLQFFAVSGLCTAILALGCFSFFGSQFVAVLVIGSILGLLACYFLGMATLMYVWSRVTKVRGRDALLDLVPWRGDERVLDVGCGRGLLLVAAARRLTTGRAFGVDIWQSSDQSRNSPDGAAENAAIEGVADRIEVLTADMRELPFEDGAFDGVMSHWVVHNLATAQDRTRALSEMRRVLRPEGWLILADIALRDDYMVELARLGFVERRLLVNPFMDMCLRAVSFGSFAPTTIYARRNDDLRSS